VVNLEEAPKEIPEWAETHREAVRRVLQIELIDRTQMRSYFPDSALRTEWYYGIPKSLIAYRSGS